MKWLDEVMATKRSLAEIGLLTVVREVFRNDMRLTVEQAEETLGRGWGNVAARLVKAGALRVERGRNAVRLSVAAPGDKKRERCRRLVKKGRAMRKFERLELAEVSFA